MRGHRSARAAALFACLFVMLSAGIVEAGQPRRAVWRPANKYPVLERIEARRDSLRGIVDSLKALVDERYEQEAKQKKDQKLDLRIDWSEVKLPKSPDDFKVVVPHLPPVPQFYTGTCWAFSGTSFLESEVMRLTGRRIKLSEMWIVYWEYVEKVRRYLREYGHSKVDEGSETDAVLEIVKRYGWVPREAYPGVLDPDGMYDHVPMMEDLRALLDMVRDRDLWDETVVLPMVRSILDRYLGPPPETCAWEGENYDPRAFASEVLRIDPDAYVTCQSRLEHGIYKYGQYALFDVPDNWRRKENYLNLPLKTWMKVIEKSVKAGYSLAIGGDNSEPGVDGKFDAADIPEWDIPAKKIDQVSREMRILNGTTGDDHGIHLVGWTRVGGRDWYLIKDSNRSSRLGRFKGYYFFSGDYIKLKMLTFTVHKDMLEGLLPQ